MAYVPQFTITSALLNEVECVAALRERIQSAAVDLAWIPALQNDARTRNVHASALETIRHDDVLELHRILAGAVMDQGEAGRYRTIPNDWRVSRRLFATACGRRVGLDV